MELVLEATFDLVRPDLDQAAPGVVLLRVPAEILKLTTRQISQPGAVHGVEGTR